MQKTQQKLGLCLLGMLLLTAVTLMAANQSTTYNGKEIRANRIVVVNNSIFNQVPAKSNQTTRLESTRQAFQSRTIRQIPGQGISEWEIKGDMQKALNALNAIDGISAFPNFVFKREDIQRKPMLETTVIPNDPYLSYQWALNNDGSFASGAVAGADISAFDAWGVTTGGTYIVGGVTSDIIVALFDDGIDINHEDLANNIWVNPGEDLNKNGVIDASEVNNVDDDNNGFVDDFYGWSVIYDDNSYLNWGSYHGTHVAGIIGAEGNNGIGIAGVNHHIKMLSVMIWDEWGDTDAITLMYGYYYLSTLLKSGVKILAVNQSWGGGRDLNDRDDQRFIDVMTKYAREHDSLGMIWACSAGNDNLNTDKLNYYTYPRLIQSPNIIVVGSTDYCEQKSDFSNYGLATVDIGAPGTDIASCLPYDDYAFMSGTSMATPHVTGVIALAKSVFPGDDAHALIARMMATADHPTAYNDLWNTEGRLNAYAAVDPAATLSSLPVSANPAHIQKNFTDDYGVNTVGFVNATGSAITVSNIALSGAQASYFNFDSPTNLNVAAGGAFGVPVKFVSNEAVASPYNATLTITTTGGNVAIPLVGIEQNYAEMLIDPIISDLGITHFGDTLTSAFTITNTGKEFLDYHLFQVLLSDNVESNLDVAKINNFKPVAHPTTKPAINKKKTINEQFELIEPDVAALNRPKITLDFTQPSKENSETILWSDNLNDSAATMTNWTLLSYGSGEGADENWHLIDISDTDTKDFAFLAGDFDNGYKNNTIAVAVSPLFDFAPQNGKAPAYLSFDYAALLENGWDFFYVNVIVNGERWGTILETDWNLTANGNMYRATADLSELVGLDNVEFWFILNTDDSWVDGFGALFDNVEISTTDVPCYADNYHGSISPAGQVTINSTIRTGMLDLGEYYLANVIESNALVNWFGINLIHFNSVIGHLSIDPTESELGSFYRNQTALSDYNLINDGQVDIEFESNWFIQNNYLNNNDERDILIFRGAENEVNRIVKSDARKEGVRVKPYERIKKVAEQYANINKLAKSTTKSNQLVKSALTSKIFRPETAGSAGPLLAENFDASLEMPAGWLVEDWTFGLGDVWHIEHIADINSNVLYFGNPDDWQYYANSETYAYSPVIDVSAVPDSENIFLEFDYACYVEENYDYFDLYVGIVVSEDPSDIRWMWAGSTEWYDFINDGELHSISFNLSSITSWLTYNKLIFCFGAWSDGSVSDGGILVDNVLLDTKFRDVYISPLFGTIKTGETLPAESHINMKYIKPGDYVMGSEFSYYLTEELRDVDFGWDFGQSTQWSTFTVLNHKPVAVDDTLNVLAGDTVNAMVIITDAMDNDYDEDLDELFIWNVTDPLYGSFKQTSLIEEDSHEYDSPKYFSYVAPLNYDGYDVFQYQISDGFDIDNGTVTIRIANKPHFVTGTQQEYTFLEDTTLVLNTMRCWRS
jgi:subtilisin family serine protease